VALVRRADRNLPGGGFATVADVILSGVRQGVLGKALSALPVSFRPHFYREWVVLANSGTVRPRVTAADSPVSCNLKSLLWCLLLWGSYFLFGLNTQLGKCTLNSATCNGVLVWVAYQSIAFRQ
jgi:hypothetical protein